jgi:SAM-dependent methyltransferase
MSHATNAAEVYDAHPDWGQAQADDQRERVAVTLGLVPDDVRTVLDVGCGDGALTNPLAERGLTVAGMDVSTVALDHVRAPSVVGDVARMPFADDAFDLVLCTEVLEHLPEDVYPAARRELQRVAGRYLLVATPNEEYLPARYCRCAACGCVFHRGHHCRTFDQETHAALFAGFEGVKTVAIGERTYRPLVTRLEQGLLGLYPKRGHRCPLCHSTEQVPRKARGWRKVGKKLIRLIGKLSRERVQPRWIATLYRARERS